MTSCYKLFHRQSRNLSRNALPCTNVGISNSYQFSPRMIVIYRSSSSSFINFEYGKSRKNVARLYPRIAQLLYLTRCVWRMHFSARPTYVCKWPGIRAQIHNVREKIYIFIGQRRFSASKEIYYYEHRDIVDHDFNGILVSRSIAPRVSSFRTSHLFLSRSLARSLFRFCSNCILFYSLSPHPVYL